MVVSRTLKAREAQNNPSFDILRMIRVSPTLRQKKIIGGKWILEEALLI